MGKQLRLDQKVERQGVVQSIWFKERKTSSLDEKQAETAGRTVLTELVKGQE